jgi:hypothetical protein
MGGEDAGKFDGRDETCEDIKVTEVDSSWMHVEK